MKKANVSTKKPYKSLGASSRVRLEAALDSAAGDGYQPMGPVRRQIRLWHGNLYQMLFVQDVKLVEDPTVQG